jgi:hypothetical protein
MNKRDFIHDNFPMQSKASPYLQLGTDYFVINPAWQSGKLPMPITEETTVNSKLQSKLQIEKAVEIISEEISPKEKDIEIMPDEEEVDNLREIALVNGIIINAIDNPFRAVTTRDKKKQNFREVLPKKSRKRKEWK